MHQTRLRYLLIPVAAFLATLPLLIQGCSCGHDFDFHLLSWMEAARQFTHGNLHPHWAYTPAYNAGEPRFVFYPPLSWGLGALLGLLFPWTWIPILYTWLVLTASGLALHLLARDFASPTAALVAAILYTVNPYMPFTAYQRTTAAIGLSAFYILPPAYERRYVHNAMTISPNMRTQDNFPFHHPGDPAHAPVLPPASVIAVILITLTVAILLFLRSTKPGTPHL